MKKKSNWRVWVLFAAVFVYFMFLESMSPLVGLTSLAVVCYLVFRKPKKKL